jgi:pyruvate formate lyase activating enzyme
MIEAKYYEKLKDKKVKCHLCPQECIIKPDQHGYCHVRINIEGVLYTTIFDKVSSIAIDPIEKKPLFHFFPGKKIFSIGTLGCNMKCKHCQNWQIAQPERKGAKKTVDTFTVPDLMDAVEKYECELIAWTYNEPMIWFEYALEGLKAAKAKGIKTVFVTNGYINLEPFKELAPYLDAMSIDLKGFSKESYIKLTGTDAFESVKSLIKWVKDNTSIHMEIVTNLVTTINDDPEELKAMAKWIYDEIGDCMPWHVTSFRPMLELRHLEPTPLKTIEGAVKAGKDAGLKYVYTGNLIYNEHENTYCPHCNEILVHRVDYDVLTKNYNQGKCNKCEKSICIIDA